MSGRRRDSTIDDRIFEVAMDLMREVGYNRFTVEALCERMGIAKTTVYKRWPSRQKLLDAALAERLRYRSSRPGGFATARDRMLRLVQDELDVASSADGSAIVAGLLVSRDESAERYLVGSAFDDRKKAMTEVVESAMLNGELDVIDPNLTVDDIFACVWGSLVTGKSLQEKDADHIVDSFLSFDHDGAVSSNNGNSRLAG